MSTDPDSGEQEHLPGRADHSTFGVRHAVKILGPHAGQLLAFCIAGHHGGLPNATPADAREQRSSLNYRLNESGYSIPAVELPANVRTFAPLASPFRLESILSC